MPCQVHVLYKGLICESLSTLVLPVWYYICFITAAVNDKHEHMVSFYRAACNADAVL